MNKFRIIYYSLSLEKLREVILITNKYVRQVGEGYGKCEVTAFHGAVIRRKNCIIHIDYA